MSILIKGMEMEMPRNCWECEFNKSTLDRMDFCTLTNKQYNWGLSERPSDCPLIEVSEDVQPVVHGKNLDRETPSIFTCSVCGWHSWDTYCGDTSEYNYCPNCEARMNGDKNG